MKKGPSGPLHDAVVGDGAGGLVGRRLHGWIVRARERAQMNATPPEANTEYSRGLGPPGRIRGPPGPLAAPRRAVSPPGGGPLRRPSGASCSAASAAGSRRAPAPERRIHARCSTSTGRARGRSLGHRRLAPQLRDCCSSRCWRRCCAWRCGARGSRPALVAIGAAGLGRAAHRPARRPARRPGHRPGLPRWPLRHGERDAGRRAVPGDAGRGACSVGAGVGTPAARRTAERQQTADAGRSAVLTQFAPRPPPVDGRRRSHTLTTVCFDGDFRRR